MNPEFHYLEFVVKPAGVRIYDAGRCSVFNYLGLPIGVVNSDQENCTLYDRSLPMYLDSSEVYLKELLEDYPDHKRGEDQHGKYIDVNFFPWYQDNWSIDMSEWNTAVEDFMEFIRIPLKD